MVTCPQCNSDVEREIEASLDRSGGHITSKGIRLIMVYCPSCNQPFVVADARGRFLERKEPHLEQEIERIIRAASDGYTEFTAGDHKVIEMAVCDFVRDRLQLQPRYGSKGPEIKNLAELLNNAIKTSGDRRTPHHWTMISENVKKELCRKLAQWINENYRLRERSEK